MISGLIGALKRDEGWSGHPYRDTRGFLTIGYGFLIDERRSVKLPKAVGELWLEILAMERAEEIAKAWEPFSKQDMEIQLALANMSYQLGVRGVLNFKRMLLALERNDRLAAAQEALDSRWARQTPERAARIAAMIKGE